MDGRDSFAHSVSGRALRASAPFAAAAALALAVFHGGGSGDTALPLVGSIAIALAALVLVATGRAALPLPALDRAGRVAVLAGAGLAAWAGLSLAWTTSGEETWAWFGRLLACFAFLLLGLAAGAARTGTRTLAVVLLGVVAVALAWALAGLAVPSFHPDGDRVARLREPVEYWNALALLAGSALPLAVLLATGTRGRVRRAAGSALAYLAVLALLLTQSRAGLIAAVAAVAVVLLCDRARIEAGLALATGAVPAAIVAGWAFTRPALVEDGAGRAARVADAPWFVAFAALGLLVTVAIAWRTPIAALAVRRARGLTHLLVALVVAAAITGVFALTVAVGNPVRWAGDQVSGGECANDPSRLATLCANNRLAWWGDALELARAHPVVGTGAGTFAIARLGVRDDAIAVREPHSVPLQLLADLGAVGLGLGAVFAAAIGIAARRAIRRARAEERRLLVALAALPLVWGIHALVDYDLDFLAVTAPTLVVAGALLSCGRTGAHRRRPGGSVLATLGLAVVAVAVLVLPSLAAGAVADVYRALERGDVAAAADAARLARRLDPVALGPLYAQAEVADAAGDAARALQLLVEATERQPRDPEPWLALGRYQVASEPPGWCGGYEALNEAYTLDPRSSRWVPGGPLDDARDAVNAGACEP
ncbi:MAG: O-antigen ligase domain-containing protein [Thermoleophilia bacterium]|nr:O-antigen ligase domain-containing protein [Thermoleophilia bacterium]